MVVVRVNSAIPQINRYPAHECLQNVLYYPLDRDLSSGYCYPPFKQPEL